MKEITKGLYVGGIEDYRRLHPSWAVVSATQTVHYDLFGWDRKLNKPNRNHLNYISYKDEDRFTLNWVDGGKHLYKWSSPKLFTSILNFIEEKLDKRNVLIHCDQGISRSPTLGMLYLAKRAKSINDESYEKAAKEFKEIYPSYSPKGIGEYVNDNWDTIT